MSVNLTDVVAMSTTKAKEYGIYTVDKYIFDNDDARDAYFNIAKNYAELNGKTKIFMEDSNIMMIYTGDLSLPYNGDNFNALMGASGSNLAISAGRITESTFTYNEGLGTVTISEGKYRLFHTSDFRGEATDHTLPTTTLAFEADRTAYVAVSWNNGNPIMYMEYDSSQFNNSSIVVPYTISRVSSDNTSSGFSVLDWGLEGVGLSNKSVERFLDTARFARANGLDLSVDDLGAVLISSGAVYAGVSKQIFADTTSNADECFLRIKTATGWDRQSALTFPNDKYDSTDGSGLRDLTDGYYGIVWIYRDMGTPKRIHLILGNEQFVGSEEASASTLPNNVDTLLDSDALLIGNVIFEKGSYDNLIVKSAFDKVFVPSLVNDHQGLANLQGGELGKYYHLPLKNQEDYILAVDFDNKLIGVGTNDFSTIDPDNVPKMIVKSERDSRNIVIISSDTNEYTQVNLKNKNVGDKASVNIVCSADNSSSSEHHYIGMGIASSVFSDPLFTIASPDDGHLSMAGGNLLIGTVTANDVVFATGGAMAENEKLRFVDDDSSLKYTIKTHKPNIDKIDSFIFTKANGVTSILKIDTLNDKAIIDKIEYDLKTQTQIDALSPTESLTVFNTTTKELNYYNGTTWINLGSANKITDVDGDTKIEVEQSEDEDIIRFTVVGQEKLNMSHVADTTKFNTQPTFIINDGTKDRININDADVSLYSPDGESNIAVTDGGTAIKSKGYFRVVDGITDNDRISVTPDIIKLLTQKVGLGSSVAQIYAHCETVGQPTLGMFDGNMERVVIDKDSSRIYSPDGTKEIKVTDLGVGINGDMDVYSDDGITLALNGGLNNASTINFSEVGIPRFAIEYDGSGASPNNLLKVKASPASAGSLSNTAITINQEGAIILDKTLEVTEGIVSPDGANTIIVNDSDTRINGKFKVTDGSLYRISVDAESARIYGGHAGLGTILPQIYVHCETVGEPTLAFDDGNIRRVEATKDSTKLISPDATKTVEVTDTETTITGDLSTIGKISSTITSGGALAVGSSNVSATGTYAVATGLNTSAEGDYSIAMGAHCSATGQTSLAVGYNTKAEGSYSTALGYNTNAIGHFSTAMGRKITANGDTTFAIGLDDTERTCSQASTMTVMGGKVGIGTLTPTVDLEVAGDLKVTGNYTKAYGQATFSGACVDNSNMPMSAEKCSDGTYVTFDIANSTFTLKAGKTYKVEVNVGALSCVTITDNVAFRIAKVGWITMLGISGRIFPYGSTELRTNQPIACAIITPTTDTSYRVYCSTVEGTVTISSYYSGVTITEL